MNRNRKKGKNDDMSIIIPANFNSAAELALSFEQVVSARAFEIDGSTVIAILSAPIYLKSERDALQHEIEQAAVENFDGDFYVTYDTEVYRKIKTEMTDNVKRALLNKVKAR